MSACPNIVVLTPGSSGSSVLSGLLSRGGYWLGDATKRIQFDTFENAELVDLDVRILRASGYPHTFCNDIPPPSIGAIQDASHRIDAGPFEAFVEKCRHHQPWIWKDPRLCYTIHFWERFTDFENTRFLFIGRRPDQCYAGLVLKRKIPMSFSSMCEMNANYEKSCNAFLDRHGFACLRLTFEDLLLSPGPTIEQMNLHLGTRIPSDHLEYIYRGPLHRPRFAARHVLLARLRYLVHRFVAGDSIRFPRRYLSGADPTDIPVILDEAHLRSGAGSEDRESKQPM